MNSASSTHGSPQCAIVSRSSWKCRPAASSSAGRAYSIRASILGSIVIPGLVNGHRHLLCCAKGAMPEGGQTLSALRQFIYPSFAALTEDDMHVYARHAAAEMIRFGTTL